MILVKTSQQKTLNLLVFVMARQRVFRDERNNIYIYMCVQFSVYSERPLGFTNFEVIQVHISFQRSPEFRTLHVVYPCRKKKFLPPFVVAKQGAA